MGSCNSSVVISLCWLYPVPEIFIMSDVERQRTDVMRELTADQVERSEKLISSYKRWKVLIISIITFIFIFIIAFLITMFVFKDF